jgi:hypothetical protein
MWFYIVFRIALPLCLRYAHLQQLLFLYDRSSYASSTADFQEPGNSGPMHDSATLASHCVLRYSEA